MSFAQRGKVPALAGMALNAGNLIIEHGYRHDAAANDIIHGLCDKTIRTIQLLDGIIDFSRVEGGMLLLYGILEKSQHSSESVAFGSRRFEDPAGVGPF